MTEETWKNTEFQDVLHLARNHRPTDLAITLALLARLSSARAADANGEAARWFPDGCKAAASR